MLTMPAGKLSNPMAFFVLMETGDGDGAINHESW
jgi:hypothetical protein